MVKTLLLCGSGSAPDGKAVENFKKNVFENESIVQKYQQFSLVRYLSSLNDFLNLRILFGGSRMGFSEGESMSTTGSLIKGEDVMWSLNGWAHWTPEKFSKFFQNINEKLQFSEQFFDFLSVSWKLCDFQKFKEFSRIFAELYEILCFGIYRGLAGTDPSGG